MKKFLQSALAVAALAVAAQASAVTINFETLAVGTTVSNQFAALGATFTANAFVGAGSSSSLEDWATTTDMTVVSSTGTDVGGLGTPSLVSGNLLRSFNGWLAEDGDPSFRITFSGLGATAFSADFASVSTPADVRIFAYNGATLLSTTAGSVTTGQFTLSVTAPKITSVVITPGSYDDWVGVDNINFTLAAVPEPETYALMGLGFGVVALARRRARAAA